MCVFSKLGFFHHAALKTLALLGLLALMVFTTPGMETTAWSENHGAAKAQVV